MSETHIGLRNGSSLQSVGCWDSNFLHRVGKNRVNGIEVREPVALVVRGVTTRSGVSRRVD